MELRLPSAHRAPDNAAKDRVPLVVTGAALSLILYLAMLHADPSFAVGAPFGRDFLNFWLGGRLALNGETSTLTDFVLYNALAEKTFHYLGDFFTFSYPPLILPFLTPFGAAPYVVGLLIWTGLNLAALVATVRQLKPEWRMSWLVCLSPAAAIMVIYGHFIGVLAWLATFVLRRAHDRPALAGVCLALIAVKPQLAGLFGLVLLVAGRWRAVAWSIPAFAGLALVSVGLYGLPPWFGFVDQTLVYQTWILKEFIYDHLQTMISAYAGLRRIGLGDMPAQVLQYALSAVVLARAGVLLKRGQGRAGDLLPVILAVIVALPYSNHYDLALAAPAMTVALLSPPEPDERAFLPPIAALLLWVTPHFGMMGKLEHVPVAAIALTAFTLYLLFRPRSAEPPATAHPDGAEAAART